jgi:NTP pyrophosphatase (non-canonical NTP hydrolase)
MNCEVKSTMSINEMQAELIKTAIYPKEAAVIYPLLGLIGEVGEFSEKLLEAIFPNGSAKGLLECDLYLTLKNFMSAAKDAERLKKVIRDKTSTYDKSYYEQLAKKVKDGLASANMEDLELEMGDFAAWYVSALSNDMGFNLKSIFKKNLDKVTSRKKRGVSGGSGDHR